MSIEKGKSTQEQAQANPFWILFIVLVLLAGDYAFRMYNLVQQRTQLDNARIMQAQNSGALAQARQLEARLEGLSLDLLQIAKTNTAARKIVQDFNIQWNPGPAAPSPAPLPTPASQKK